MVPTETGVWLIKRKRRELRKEREKYFGEDNSFWGGKIPKVAQIFRELI